MAACKSCNADVVWVETSTGKKMPMDAKPDPKGTFVIINGKARKVTVDDRRLFRETYTSHFATCAQADDWRKNR